MRDIKFRAWDKDLGMSYYPVSIDFNSDGTLRGMAIFQSGLQVEIRGNNSMVWMQSTGLKDKAGKEIYENDIVDNVWIDGEIYSKGKVIFESGCFTIQTKSGQHQYCPCLNEAWQEKIEVIGNSFENPSLLDESRRTKERLK